MKEFLKNIKLIEHLTTEVEIQKSEFVSRLKQHVDEGSTGMFSHTFEVFSSSNNEYRGQVGQQGFRIRRRRKFFDGDPNFAIAKGTYKQNNEKLIIETEINGFNEVMIPFYFFAVIFYSVIIGDFFISDNIEGSDSGISLTLILIHAVFLLGITYFVMRRSTKSMKHELEREFYYIIKK